MRSGNLRHYVTLERYISTGATLTGAGAGDWEVVSDNIPAEVITLNGRELQYAEQIVPQSNVKVMMRYRDDIKDGDRLLFGDRILNIGHINRHDEMPKRQLTLLCTSTKGDNDSVGN